MYAQQIRKGESCFYFFIFSMLVIRLNRTGRKNQASFRIAVQEKTIAPGGRHVEMVGSWDPYKKVAVFKNERVLYWLGQGAQPSDTVYNLLVSNSLIEGKKRAVKIVRPVKEVVSDQQPASNEKDGENTGESSIAETKEGETAGEGVEVEDTPNKKEEISATEKSEEVGDK